MSLKANNTFPIICLFFLQKKSKCQLSLFNDQMRYELLCPEREPQPIWALSRHLIRGREKKRRR